MTCACCLAGVPKSGHHKPWPRSFLLGHIYISGQMAHGLKRLWVFEHKLYVWYRQKWNEKVESMVREHPRILGHILPSQPNPSPSSFCISLLYSLSLCSWKYVLSLSWFKRSNLAISCYLSQIWVGFLYLNLNIFAPFFLSQPILYYIELFNKYGCGLLVSSSILANKAGINTCLLKLTLWGETGNKMDIKVRIPYVRSCTEEN